MSLQGFWGAQRESCRPGTLKSARVPSNVSAKEAGWAHGRPRSVNDRMALILAVQWWRADGRSAGSAIGVAINAREQKGVPERNINVPISIAAGYR